MRKLRGNAYRNLHGPEACRTPLAYHTRRERRLADGFATAPSRTPPQDQAIAQALGLGRPTLSESESKQLLAAWGVASAREHRTNSAEAAVAAAEQLGFPVALKVDSPDIAHKTEAGSFG
jgi:acyl-CoA synthetase (NDP forming)